MRSVARTTTECSRRPGEPSRSCVVSTRDTRDFFVPVSIGGEVVAVLAVGPIARARPTSANILESWRWLTGRQGHPTDPEFAAYFTATLATLVLDGQKLVKMERLLS